MPFRIIQMLPVDWMLLVPVSTIVFAQIVINKAYWILSAIPL
uniref:Uncharacterized protein n=1 Tax=Anguilla anguilla TaxID=7936 RepID=A0A0E9SK96_ANGAN